MVLPVLALIGAAVGGSALLGGIVGSGKKSCSVIAQEKCSKGGISELWRGEETEWTCYTRIYNDCMKEREGITSKITEKQKDVIMYGAIGLIGLSLVGKYEIGGRK